MGTLSISELCLGETCEGTFQPFFGFAPFSTAFSNEKVGFQKCFDVFLKRLGVLIETSKRFGENV